MAAKKKTAKKKTTKKTTKKVAKKSSKAGKKVQKFHCPHCKKIIAVVDLESIKDTRGLTLTGLASRATGSQTLIQSGPEPWPSV
ncbi:MAG: hypothetical protein HC945_00410 [Nitrosarchaeum sp.]|nr:hypothetical protein [Nitrosarchaeum sp.]